MAGTKRSAPDSTGLESRETRSKVARTNGSPMSKGKPQSKGKSASKTEKKATKAPMAFKEFKAKALPLHVNFTHTPPALSNTEDDDDKVQTTAADPGSIGSATLVPSQFSTGSYGWKGSKRVVIEVPNPEGAEGEKLQIMISINATVIGSKNTKEGDNEGEAKEDNTKDEEKAEDGAAE